jgi:transposase
VRLRHSATTYRSGARLWVVAISLIPRRPGERIKTDRRVWVPDQAHEAIRDLVRARQAAVRTLRQTRQQLSGFLLRHGRHYHRPAWTQLHRRWLASLKFDQAVHHIVLEDYIAAVKSAMARRDRLEAHIEAAFAEWSLAPVVEAGHGHRPRKLRDVSPDRR